MNLWQHLAQVKQQRETKALRKAIRGLNKAQAEHRAMRELREAQEELREAKERATKCQYDHRN